MEKKVKYGYKSNLKCKNKYNNKNMVKVLVDVRYL